MTENLRRCFIEPIADLIVRYAYSIKDAIRYWIANLPLSKYGGRRRAREFHFNSHKRIVEYTRTSISSDIDPLMFDFLAIGEDGYRIRMASIDRGGRPRLYVYQASFDISELVTFCTSHGHTNKDFRQCQCFRKKKSLCKTKLDKEFNFTVWYETHYLFHGMQQAL
jgi:hypothetical protein